MAYYPLNEMPAGVDPLGPENLLIFAPGVLTGAAVSGQGRNGVGAKSPLIGGLRSSEVSGFLGSELKRAGFDAIDDSLPRRFFSPFQKGEARKAVPLDGAAFEWAKRYYYQMMGWDEQAGIPTRDALERLDIAWAA